MTRTKVSILAASLAVATGLFWAKILISPSVTLAAPDLGSNVNQIVVDTSRTMPSFEDKYQRHMGVLDVLETR